MRSIYESRWVAASLSPLSLGRFTPNPPLGGEFLWNHPYTKLSHPFLNEHLFIPQVRVSIGIEIFSVNHVYYRYYQDTRGSKCVAYGPGLQSGAMGGVLASFMIQAKNSAGENRNSGLDQVSLKIRQLPSRGKKGVRRQSLAAEDNLEDHAILDEKEARAT